jgi:hypothetical protein
MDPNNSTPTPYQSGQKSDNKVFKILSIEFVVFIFAVLIIVGIFNYFNIIQLGFLPQKEVKTKTTEAVAQQASPTPEQPSAEEIKNRPFIACPVSIELCRTGEQVIEQVNGETIYGLKFENILSDSSIFAVIGGQKEAQGAEITIDNPDRGIQVRYKITGDIAPVSSSIIGENENLGVVTSDTSTLILYATATITKQPVKLGIEPEGKYLTNLE